ncbi:hypothetical protein R6Z07F_019420 [Ovis aries]|uniref:Beta-defensin n=1 Tax=Ovis aries TaxID=9940 RepID=E2ITD7_SHEEP|nr:beta-defensin 2 precursor [Ovis aries]ADN93290.1 beta-defensin [Ovis aries]
MRLHHLLLVLFFVVLSAGSGFTHGVTDSLSCRWKKGICVLTKCPGTMRQIGTCFGPPVKCCRLK